MPLEKILARALSHGGQFADIFFESKTETSLSLENNRIEKTVCGIDTGLGIRVIEDFHAFYAYTNDRSFFSSKNSFFKILELRFSDSKYNHGSQQG